MKPFAQSQEEKMSDAIPSPDDLPSDWDKGMSPPSTHPTTAQLMADPRVAALVEAASALVGILEIASVLPTAIQKIYIPRMDAPELVSTRAALAQLKEPTNDGN
jgi:hypothetical protein